MASIVPGRMTVENESNIVVFLVGARINKWWLLPFAIPILSRMRKMQQELLSDPDSGLLAIQSLGSADVQYWKSAEHLMAYASDSGRSHKPAWQAFYKKLFKNEAVGLWHETYRASAGTYESLYVNMPRFGLGKALALTRAEGSRKSIRQRLSA